MLLGDVIARLDDEVVALEALVSLDDLSLLAEVEAAASRDGLTPGGFAARAVQAFTASASDEDWVSLIGTIGRAEDPGGACLKGMLAFALKASRAGPACGHAH
ncbi:hypothetical protein [Salinarimonas ramus]|uniref:Uncharacterized protein n=1 Tax=Salinarimonas ramus TaxID=690164 RepID=A0A917V8W7_9HYPH|nr:hypothetical protein [Salinarimonas ramus]GGK51366.1 hypothetical protein GCM10011322_43010 [Salinarimonas ramus]